MQPSLNDEAWRWIKREGRPATFARGDQLMREGDRASHVFAIASGEVKILAESITGNPVLLAIVGPDQTIGVLSAFDLLPREFTVIARNDVAAWALTREQYLRMFVVLPEVGIAQLEALAIRFRMTIGMCVGRSDDLASRISHRLQAMSEESANGELDLTQSELASWVGASREATVRCLCRLRAAGAITTRRGHITVTDGDALASFEVL